MARRWLTREQAKAAVLAELSLIDCDPIDLRDIEILGSGSEWRPIVRRIRARIDEAQLAVVCEVGRRLASSYDIAS